MRKSAKDIARDFQNACNGMRPHELFDAVVELLFHAAVMSAPGEKALLEMHRDDINGLLNNVERAGVGSSEFADLAQSVVSSLSDEFDDFLGDLAAHIGALDSGMGQYFTPSEVARLLSRLQMDDEAIWGAVSRHGRVVSMDPAAGSGGLLLRFAERVRDAGFDHRRQLFVEATDLSPHAFRMCYVQLAARDIPAMVIQGDSLTGEVRQSLYTPAYFRWFAPHQERIAHRAIAAE